MKNIKFIKSVEKMVDPISSGTLHFMQGFSDMLPASVQSKVVKNSAKTSNVMGFIVDPYCYFLCYKITDLDYFEKLLPKNFRLTKSSVFKGDEEEYYFIIGSFNARTSAFYGNRVEAYVIAENMDTGLTSWIIVDYISNTISFDSRDGLTPASSSSIITTDFDGNVIVDTEDLRDGKKLKFISNISSGNKRELDSKLWVDGNLSVAYSNNYSSSGDVFGLKFDTQEMASALEIDNVLDLNNEWYSNYIEEKPNKLVCFPYAQHFISDSPGATSDISNKQMLDSYIKNFDVDEVQAYALKNMNRKMVTASLINMSIIIILVILLLFTNI